MEMVVLLEKYKACDMFSLTQLAYNKRISPDVCQKACEDLRLYNKKQLKEYYKKFEKEIAYPFEILYKDIKEECQRFESVTDKKKYSYGFCFAHICGEVGKTTKYNEPREFFYRMYAKLGNEIDNEREIFRHTNNVGADIFDVLKKQENRPLIDNLNYYEITYKNHCSAGGGLKVNFYFNLNEETKAWLLSREEAYELEGLEDIAFYKDGELAFSSCTHEGSYKDFYK